MMFHPTQMTKLLAAQLGIEVIERPDGTQLAPLSVRVWREPASLNFVEVRYVVIEATSAPTAPAATEGGISLPPQLADAVKSTDPIVGGGYAVPCTDWLSRDLWPTQKGVYQRLYPDNDVLFCYWNGRRWCQGDSTAEEAFENRFQPSLFEPLPWRGLVLDPAMLSGRAP